MPLRKHTALVGFFLTTPSTPIALLRLSLRQASAEVQTKTMIVTLKTRRSGR